MACAPIEDSEQPGRSPSLVRVFAVRIKKADAQADLSLRWAHSHFVGFVTRRLIFKTPDLKGTQDRTKRTILVCPF